MQLRKSLLIAAILGILSCVAWELYWRSQGRIPNIDDNRDLWARQRAKLDNPKGDQAVFIGSSRILFDIQNDIWKARTGMEPVMLACQGASPLPVLREIVDHTDYAGTIFVGVTPGLFFSTTFEQAPPWDRAQSMVNYYRDRTYAQRLNHVLSLPLQRNLAFYTNATEAWDSDVDLGTLLYRQIKDERIGPLPAPFFQFEDVSIDRNVQMDARATNDTAYAQSIQLAWQDMLSSDMPPPDTPGTTSFFLEYAQKFRARGGKLVLVRFPSSHWFKQGEAMHMPRTKHWDSLVLKTKLPAYHYEDYPQLTGLNLPEWSHLSKEDADFFTEEIIKIWRKDGILTSTKTK